MGERTSVLQTAQPRRFQPLSPPAPLRFFNSHARTCSGRNDDALEFRMITRIWHGATPASKSDEYLDLMRTVAIPDYRSTPGNKGAYALRRMEGDTAHFLMVTFWESEEAIRAFAGDDMALRNTTISTRTSCWS